MLYFFTRAAARAFAVRTGRQLRDLGTRAEVGRRWAVEVV